MLTKVLVGFILVSSSTAKLQFRYQDCSNSENKIVHFENGHLSADPVMIPGNETGDVDLQILRDVTGLHYTLDVTIHKGVLKLLCHESDGVKFGSCSYELCQLLSDACPEQITETTPDFPCSCPFTAGTYHLNPTTFAIPRLEGIWNILGRGDYTVNATITDTDTQEQVACYNLELAIQTDCEGILCILG